MIEPDQETMFVINMFEHGHRAVSLDRLVTDVTGHQYKGQQTGEMMSNDTWQVYTAPDPYYASEEYDEEVDAWLAEERGEFTSDFVWEIEHTRSAPPPYIMLSWLVKHEHLPAGTYAIEVTW